MKTINTLLTLTALVATNAFANDKANDIKVELANFANVELNEVITVAVEDYSKVNTNEIKLAVIAEAEVTNLNNAIATVELENEEQAAE